jgi:hypothetical protein
VRSGMTDRSGAAALRVAANLDPRLCSGGLSGGFSAGAVERVIARAHGGPGKLGGARRSPAEPERSQGMLPAFGDGMRILGGLFVCLLLLGCRGGSATIDGTLLDADDAGYVWIEGTPDRVPVEGLAFRVQGIRGDTIDLRFATEADDAGTMRILGLGRGGTLTLHAIWFRDDRAFPTAVDLDGPRSVTINGLRMASPNRLPAAIDVQGTLLALAGDGESLMVRPAEESLPDLRVVIAPGSTVRSVDGEPASLERLSFGDTLEVRGGTEGGYVIATEIVLPRRVAAGVPRQSEDGARSGGGDGAAGATAERVTGSVSPVRGPEPAPRDPAPPAAARDDGPPAAGSAGRGGPPAEPPGRGRGRERGGGPSR